MATVSILVPVYNVQSCLEKCLESLIHQTYKDIEIVVIDDGSTDHSANICKKYQEQDDRIFLYHFENSGVAVTRNRALEKAHGDYIMFVDSDDFLDLNTTEVMLETLQRDQTDICMCGYSIDFKYGKTHRKTCKDSIITSLEALHLLVDNKGVTNYPWAKLFKRKCFDDVEFPDGETLFEDAYTILRAIANAKTISTISKRFYHYVQRRGSLTSRMDLETAYAMRISFEYQEVFLKETFPNEKFNFNTQYYNADLYILYTCFSRYKRADQVVFIPGDIKWNQVKGLHKAFYKLAYGVTKLKTGFKVEKPY